MAIRKKVKKVKSKISIIYGIFDIVNQTLIQVDLDLERLELEFDLEGYDSEQYSIIELKIAID